MRSLLLCTLLCACSSSSTNDAPAPQDSGTTVDTSSSTDASPSDTMLPEAGGCTSARDTAVKPIDSVAKGTVTNLMTDTFIVDASAGGFDMAASNPYLYIDLATGMRVDITDKQAFTSTSWDLAIKRASIRSNDGDSGPGMGGAAFLSGKTFDEVTAADATSAKLKTESWFDADCNPKTDPTGAIVTAFDPWYDYDPSTMFVTPKAGVWIVRGGKGALYKLEIVDYYAKPDGSTGGASAHYKLRWAALR